MSDVGDNTWYCDRDGCDWHIGRLFAYRIAEHQLEHERADVKVAGDLAKALAEAKIWKARLFDHLYDSLGPSRARALMDKYEKGVFRGTAE